jgi:hypothetical protein
MFTTKSKKKVLCDVCARKVRRLKHPPKRYPYITKEILTKKCILCGAEFTTKQDRKVYCVSCLKKVWYRNKKEEQK